jgi:hypothetical protein
MAGIEVLQELLPARFREVGFPYTSCETTIRHDLATHTYPDRDGGHIEATGRAPLQFTFHVPFRNGVKRARGELWKFPLYPTAYRDFIDAVSDRSTGTLQHPEFGEIRCKVENCTVALDGKQRDGVDLNVTFIENTEKPEDLQQVLASASPIAAVESNALTVDTHLASLSGLGLPSYTTSFSDWVRKIKSIPDFITLYQYQSSGPLNRLIFQANNLMAALKAMGDPLLWPLLTACERLKGAAHDLAKELKVQQRAVRLYKVESETTFAAVAAQIGAKMGEVMALNPKLLAYPTIPANTNVRYYAA